MQLGGPSNLHKDILEGKDTSIEWEDIFKGEFLGPKPRGKWPLTAVIAQAPTMSTSYQTSTPSWRHDAG